MVESSALLKRRSPKGYRGFESLPHRALVARMLFAVELQRCLQQIIVVNVAITMSADVGRHMSTRCSTRWTKKWTKGALGELAATGSNVFAA